MTTDPIILDLESRLNSRLDSDNKDATVYPNGSALSVVVFDKDFNTTDTLSFATVEEAATHFGVDLGDDDS